jgi:hypothetical protein
MLCGLRRSVGSALPCGLAHNTGAGSLPCPALLPSSLLEKQGQNHLAMLAFSCMEDLIQGPEDSTPHSCKLIVKGIALAEDAARWGLSVKDINNN